MLHKYISILVILTIVGTLSAYADKLSTDSIDNQQNNVFFSSSDSVNVLVGENLPDLDYANPREYEIGEITISGKNNYEDYVLIGFSGLKVGEKILIPSDAITNVIRRFWKQGLFSILKQRLFRLENKI